jgi:hypothetical protein
MWEGENGVRELLSSLLSLTQVGLDVELKLGLELSATAKSHAVLHDSVGLLVVL